jgi:ribonuclease BN (tRNA processing enzyme)
VPTLRFLGSGDALGSGGRFQTCLLLEGADAGGLLVDIGASSLIAMKRAGVDPSSIEWVVLTHLHGDHFAGLPFLVLDGQFSRRARPLTIAGPPGTEARVRAAMDVLFPGLAAVPQRFRVEFVELADRRPAAMGAARITPFAVVHASGAPSYALRVEYGGKVIAYSGDTEWTDALVEASADADVFVCEAYFFDKKVRYHLDWRTLAANRDRLTCRRLVLTHMSPDMLDRVGEVDVETAHDGLTLALDAPAS